MDLRQMSSSVSYSTGGKQVTIWKAIYNNCWYSIIYMSENKVVSGFQEEFEIIVNTDSRK